MSLWLTETEFRNGDAGSLGLTLNVAFLRDIKQDNPSIRSQINSLSQTFKEGEISPRDTVEYLNQFRDGIETYFALEEFYGYFKNATQQNPTVSSRAESLRTEHESLFLNLNQVCELAEQILYHECSDDVSLRQVADRFGEFARQLDDHEEKEMELMMRLCNEDLGTSE